MKNAEMLRGRRILLSPMGVVTLALFHTLKKEGFDVCAFSDNKQLLHYKTYRDIEILTPEEAYKKFPDAFVILSSYRYAPFIGRQHGELGFSDIFTCEPFLERAAMESALDDIDMAALTEINPDYERILDTASDEIAAYLLPDAALEPDALVLPILDINVTKRCTLRCRDCSALMPYYENPQDTPLSIILGSFDILSSHVDFIRRVNVLGGEPFLYKELPAVLAHLANRPKIGSLTLTTNATIMPNEDTLAALRDAGALVHISDYGKRSKITLELVEELERRGIKYYRHYNMDWHIVTRIIDGENRTEDDARRMFNSCELACHVLNDGTLNYCIFIAHSCGLQAVPEDDENRIDLFSPNLSKRSILEYMNRGKFYPACRYCSGYCTRGAPVEAAIQTKERLTYKKYEW